jgi:hypothetical protein
MFFDNKEFHDPIGFSRLEPVLWSHFMIFFVGRMSQFGAFNIGRLQ